jgi:hypothetical protein
LRDIEAGQVEQLEGAHAEARRLAHDAVDGGEVADAFAEDAQRFGDETAPGVVDDEARRIFRPHRGVAHAPAQGQQRVDTQGAVSSPSMTSTIFISGTGLKKWKPATRSGRLQAAAIDVTESDEVLVARMQSAAMMSSNCWNSDFLTSRFSTMASTMTWADASSSSRATTSSFADAASSGGLRRNLSLVGQLAEGAGHRVARIGGGAVQGVEQQHADAGLGGDLGDAAAHGTGADDADAKRS